MSLANLSEFFASAMQGEGLPMLNQALNMMIPFNEPHGFEIVDIKPFSIKTKIPYQSSNFNHLQGLHAGALMTISEFTSGIMVLMHANPSKYRIILQKLDIEYFYQGKTDGFASFQIDANWLNENVLTPLQTQESVVVPCEVNTYDVNGNHLCKANVLWQLKPWDKVKTK